MYTLRTLAPLGLLFALAQPAGADQDWRSFLADLFQGPAKKEEFRWRGAVAAGKSLEIKGINGAVRAVPAAGEEVEVLAVKSGRRNDPSEVEVAVVEHDGGITLCSVYPTAEGSPPNECQPGEGGRMKLGRNDVFVEFTVKVPVGVHMVVHTVNGAIKATGLAGDVLAETVNGSITLATEGAARAETVNGSIDARVGTTEGSERLSFETVNGGITLELPRDTNAALSAETVNGRISSELELTETRKSSRRELIGTLGSGGREVSLETVNGSIRIRRGW